MLLKIEYKFSKHVRQKKQLRLLYELYRRLRVIQWSDYENIYYCCTQKTASQWFRSIFNDPIFLKYTGLEMVPYVAFGHRRARIEKSFPTRSIITHLYINYDTYLSIPKPKEYKTFFILRDPRDIIISWYFSAKYSHRLEYPITEIRPKLETLNFQDGIKYLIDKHEEIGTFETQRSWFKAKDDPNVKIFIYEDFSRNNKAFLKALFQYIDIIMPEKVFDFLYNRNEFNKLSGGRKQGDEDQSSHYRKGISGDWKNYFDEEIMSYFREVTKDTLEILGYEI